MDKNVKLKNNTSEQKTNEIRTNSIKHIENVKNSNSKKISIQKFILFVCIFAFISCVSIMIVSDYKNKENNEINNAQIDIVDVPNVDNDKDIEISKVLNLCQIEVESITQYEALEDVHNDGRKIYRIKSNNDIYTTLFLNKDNVIDVITYDNWDIIRYLYKDGQVLAKITDYIVSVDESNILMSKCQTAVKEILKSPSTAEFKNINEWSFYKESEYILVQSYVDSQSESGEIIRSEFHIQFYKANNAIKSLVLDGKEYIK